MEEREFNYLILSGKQKKTNKQKQLKVEFG